MKRKLSVLENELLLHAFNNGYRYIARDKSKDIYFYASKPQKNDIYCVWDNKGEEFEVFQLMLLNLFDFIQFSDKEPYEIAELLKLEKRTK